MNQNAELDEKGFEELLDALRACTVAVEHGRAPFAREHAAGERVMLAVRQLLLQREELRKRVEVWDNISAEDVALLINQMAKNTEYTKPFDDLVMKLNRLGFRLLRGSGV